MTISANFKLVFLSVLGLTVLCIIVAIAIGVHERNTETMAEIPEILGDIYSIASFGWQAGTGAIFGLLGGKSIE